MHSRIGAALSMALMVAVFPSAHKMLSALLPKSVGGFRQLRYVEVWRFADDACARSGQSLAQGDLTSENFAEFLRAFGMLPVSNPDGDGAQSSRPAQEPLLSFALLPSSR